MKKVSSETWAIAALLLALALALPAAAQLPDAEAVLTELGFSSADQQKVKGGAFVTTTLKPTSDREIRNAMVVHWPNRINWRRALRPTMTAAAGLMAMAMASTRSSSCSYRTPWR